MPTVPTRKEGNMPGFSSDEIMALLPQLATKADVQATESRLFRWIVGSWIVMAGVMTAVVTAAVRFAH